VRNEELSLKELARQLLDDWRFPARVSSRIRFENTLKAAAETNPGPILLRQSMIDCCEAATPVIRTEELPATEGSRYPLLEYRPGPWWFKEEFTRYPDRMRVTVGLVREFVPDFSSEWAYRRSVAEYLRYFKTHMLRVGELHILDSDLRWSEFERNPQPRPDFAIGSEAFELERVRFEMAWNPDQPGDPRWALKRLFQPFMSHTHVANTTMPTPTYRLRFLDDEEERQHLFDVSKTSLKETRHRKIDRLYCPECRKLLEMGFQPAPTCRECRTTSGFQSLELVTPEDLHPPLPQPEPRYLPFTQEMDPTRFINFVPWGAGKKAKPKKTKKSTKKKPMEPRPAGLEKEWEKVRKLRALAASSTFPAEAALATARADDREGKILGS
jgi:hypothetical protein